MPVPLWYKKRTGRPERDRLLEGTPCRKVCTKRGQRVVMHEYLWPVAMQWLLASRRIAWQVDHEQAAGVPHPVIKRLVNTQRDEGSDVPQPINVKGKYRHRNNKGHRCHEDIRCH